MSPKNQTLLDRIKAMQYKENAELHDRLYNQTPAVSTAVAMREADRVKFNERNPEQRKSVNDFIRSIVSTDDTTIAEDTPIGQALTQIVRKYGDPYIMPVYDEIIRRSGVTTHSEKHSAPSYHLDERENAYPTVDTVTVPFGKDFIYFKGTENEYSMSPEELLSEELGHAKQFAGKSARVRALIDARSARDSQMYEDPHINPGTIEWQAHRDQNYAPAIWKEYRSILDSLFSN